jgi:hypothetical protein
MFSVYFMQRLCEALLNPDDHSEDDLIEEEVHAEVVSVESLLEEPEWGEVVYLVPYDVDKDQRPCCQNGFKVRRLLTNLNDVPARIREASTKLITITPILLQAHWCLVLGVGCPLKDPESLSSKATELCQGGRTHLLVDKLPSQYAGKIKYFIIR